MFGGRAITRVTLKIQDVNRNDELQSKCGRKQVMGYDLVTFIRGWLEERGYEEFSVAEVMMAAGHPGVKPADFFLSHCQVELVQTTLDAMSMAGRRRRCSTPAFFLDYFILRQCKAGDFDPARVRRAIGEIGHTVVVLDPHVHPWPRSHTLTYQPEALHRLWCVFELYSSLATQATISGVYTLPGMQCLNPETINAISVEDCKATKDQDKKRFTEEHPQRYRVDHRENQFRTASDDAPSFRHCSFAIAHVEGCAVCGGERDCRFLHVSLLHHME